MTGGDCEAQPLRLAVGAAEPKMREVLAKAEGSVYTAPRGEGRVKTPAGDPLS